jgi:hypothetical protein
MVLNVCWSSLSENTVQKIHKCIPEDCNGDKLVGYLYTLKQTEAYQFHDLQGGSERR